MNRCSCQCVIPPYMLEKLAKNPDVAIRGNAIKALEFAAALRTGRQLRAEAPILTAIPSATKTLTREIYHANHRAQYYLPGTLVRSEGGQPVGDASIDEAYDFSGDVYSFYKNLFDRNSLDARGMKLISSVHVGSGFNNAFWNGEQMAYGDGDGVVFGRFTQSLDIVAHELTHGVVTHTCNLEYHGESGALNEHLADVFGVLVRQWKQKLKVDQDSWLIGAEIIVHDGTRSSTYALRTLTGQKAYLNDPYLGDDPQPKHYENLYKGEEDNGGVHINSGIPNHAFYIFAKSLGGYAWEDAGSIWYKAMLSLNPQSRFSDMVEATTAATIMRFGAQSTQHLAIVKAWREVGLDL